jgi:MerR family transcriptional regulator, light-induced transcriptional regulator
MSYKAKYSIKDLETLSGIKAHTIRIWEKRYQIFSPERSDTNIRVYSNDDLKLLLNISLLNKHGYKISRIIQMSPQQMVDLLIGINLVKSESDDLVDALITSMIEMDEQQFNRVLTAGIFKMGFEETIQQVVFRFFSRIGIMWQVGSINPAQEHFVSNLFRQKLHAAIDSLPVQTDARSLKIILFLPEKEQHELSLLFYNYALKARGFHTVYLGQAVPVETLKRVIEIINPDFLLGTLTTSLDPDDLDPLLMSIHGSFPQGRILISGSGLNNYSKELPLNMVRFPELCGLLKLLER